MYGIFEDITETEESLDRWQNLVEQCPLPITIYQDYNIIFTNEASVGFYEVESLDDLVGSNILNYIHPEDKKVLIDRKSKLQNGHLLEPSETRLVTKKELLNISLLVQDQLITTGRNLYNLYFLITEIRNQQILIEKSLKEKDILLKEIHHRVKNNLAIVSGLLELQVQSIKDEGTIAALKDSQNRIQSIALVHQQLYQFESFDEIHLDLYLNDLISGLKKTLDSSRTIDFKIESDHIKISIEYAIPCSLILNEVVINAYKHAFINVSNPTINISVKQKDNNVELEVCDNGIGFSKKDSSKEKSSLGSTLIEILTQQIYGNYNYSDNSESGTCFKLTFPIR